jgi:AraC-like DNA-binding protein
MYEIIYPGNETLKNHIRYIYKVSSAEKNFKRHLMIFPNVGSAIAIFKDVNFISNGKQEFSSFEEPGNKNVILHLNRKDPITIKETGRHKRIVIVFKPLGINHFLNIPVAELVKDNNPTLIPLISIDKTFEQFYDVIDPDRPLCEYKPLIEEILLNRYNEFSNAILDSCVSEIMDTEGNKKIEEIAIKKRISIKTINRLFHKYIGLNPVAFRKIIQFRNAVKCKLDDSEMNNTNIAFENNYYDLPYMMRVFKEMTGITVTDFFKKVSFSDDKQYVYIG